MTTCKDCFHDNACGDVFRFFGSIADYKNCNVETQCKHFKNKADVVTVVRCKECMFWDAEKVGWLDECVCKLHSVEGIYSKYKLPNDYCSYGERKD